MVQPYIGEIRMFAGSFSPSGWAFCDGSLLSIEENEALFMLIGTSYGGDGESTFGLPDLRGRLPVHLAPGSYPGQQDGVEQVTLTVPQVPQHVHAVQTSTSAGSSPDPAGRVLAADASLDLYREDSATAPLAGTAVGPAGGSQPHSNLMPYLCVGFIISLFGVYPPTA